MFCIVLGCVYRVLSFNFWWLVIGVSNSCLEVHPIYEVNTKSCVVSQIQKNEIIIIVVWEFEGSVILLYIYIYIYINNNKCEKNVICSCTGWPDRLDRLFYKPKPCLFKLIGFFKKLKLDPFIKLARPNRAFSRTSHRPLTGGLAYSHP